MYSDSDFERFYVGYMAEAMPRGVSIQVYCKKNNVLYNLFDKWYTDTRHKVVPVTVKGKLTEERDPEEPEVISPKGDELRIMIDIRMTNGQHMQQRNLSYRGLVKLVGSLEGLC